MLSGLIAAVVTLHSVSPVRAAFDQAMINCASGGTAGCRRLISRMLEHKNLEEMARFFPSLDAGCTKGVADGCTGAAMAEYAGAGTPRKPLKADRDMEAACAKGSSTACTIDLEEKARGDQDAAARAKRFSEGQALCDKLGGVVCYTVAGWLDEGWGTTKDKTKARKLGRKACETGSARACLSEAGILWDEHASKETVRPLYEKACDGDLGLGCGALGELTEPPDGPEAKALYLRGCQLGEAIACDQLAGDDEASRRKACGLGGAESCAEIAFKKAAAIEHGEDPEGLQEVLTLLQKACKRASKRSCGALGEVPKNAIHACEAGKIAYCLQAGFVYQMGISIPAENGESIAADAARARAAFEKACTGGVKSACAHVIP